MGIYLFFFTQYNAPLHTSKFNSARPHCLQHFFYIPDFTSALPLRPLPFTFQPYISTFTLAPSRSAPLLQSYRLLLHHPLGVTSTTDTRTAWQSNSLQRFPITSDCHRLPPPDPTRVAIVTCRVLSLTEYSAPRTIGLTFLGSII